MSHIVEAKTSIQNPNPVLLRQAVELVAQQLEGGRVADHYFTYAGKRVPARLALFSDVIERGIGIIVKKETGELTFIGDPFMYEEVAEAAQQQIVQTYVSLATMQALQQMGYQTTAEDGEEGQIYLTGVSQYA
jgi:hypothetical protein